MAKCPFFEVECIKGDCEMWSKDYHCSIKNINHNIAELNKTINKLTESSIPSSLADIARKI